MKEQIEKALAFDPLHVAEKLTGEDYHASMETTALGFLLMQGNNKEKRRLLSESMDTYWGIPLDSFLKVFTDDGFVRVYEESFLNRHVGSNGVRAKENCYVYAKAEEGLLLFMDTFSWKDGEPGVNSAHLYLFNRYEEGSDPFFGVGSSSPVNKDGEYLGRVHSIDAREGIMHKLGQFREKGRLEKVWPAHGMLWFIHHGHRSEDGVEVDYEGITNGVINSLPQDVRDMLGDRE